MVYTENGTYTAVRRRAPHHCMRSPSEAMPLRNRGVLSATPCISTLLCCYVGVHLQGSLYTECLFVIPGTVMLVGASMLNL
jgi:hypothetical protein